MQTIEDFAVELSTKEVKGSDQYSQGLKVGIEFGVEKGAEFVQKQYDEKIRWIPVSELLPHTDCSVKYSNGNQSVCRFSGVSESDIKHVIEVLKIVSWRNFL